MKAQNLLTVTLGFILMSATAFSQVQWREQGLRAADRLADRIEVLDETLHLVYEDHSTPEFAMAIEDIHHIEDLVLTMLDMFPVASYNQLCFEFGHLYQDLVAIRLDLIRLGLEANPDIVRAWNNMADVYNYEMNPVFANCGHYPYAGGNKARNAPHLSRL